MKSTTFAVGSLLAAAAVAQPHRQQHQHRANHVKKDASSDIVWVTDWVSVTETVGVTTTIWVEPGFVPPTQTASQASTTPAQAATVASSSSAAVGGEFFQPAAQQASSSSTSVYVAPSPSSTYVAPVSVVQSSTPVVVAPTTTAAPATTAPATSAATQAATTAAAGVGTGAITSSCSSSSNSCTGDFTYYDTGLGACGITNDGSVDKVVALSVDMMGSSSNVGQGSDANSYCGKTITVSYGGKEVVATVVDKCMGCSEYSVDLSRAAFDVLADESLGRGTAKWWFN